MSRRRRLLALCLGVLGSACGGDDDPSGPPGPSALAKQAGDGQTAAVGQAVATAPSVKVTNASNQGVSGVSVSFAVASGGGSVTGATATTDANGIATVGSWTLGQTPGANTLTATAAGTGISGSPATFTATANVGAPRTLTKEAGDNQTANTGAAVAVAPAVKVVDQFGNPISGQTVTFAVASGGGTITGATPTTGADGRATVGSWTLGATAGANTLTATVAGTGITGNPATFTATGQVASFNPTANTSLGGTNNYASVNIPAGVTVTATSDLVINATGNITIAGTITGDCRAITVSATGTLTMTGTVRNVCPATAAGTGANLSLIGRAGYNLSGTGTVATSGNFDLTNDPTLTDADFLRVVNNRDLTTSGARITTGAQGDIVYQGGPVCIVNGRAFNAEPPDAKKGADGGATGQPGDNGSTWTLRCRGNMEMSNTSVTGENGGQGGEGRDENNPNGANATGGAGGNGGLLKVQSTLSMGLNGNNQFTSGRGGQGAQAIASGGPNPTPTTAASATATGGKGGNAGLIEVSGKGGIIISGLLRMIVGDGAAGGIALATGANGMNAIPTRIAQHGGPATSTGGAGGTVPNKNLSSSGSVTGLGNVQVTGGNGGPGGGATSQAGNGGAGVFPVDQNKPGGNGGNFTANGGNGGNTGLRDANNTLVGTGGNGGNMSVKNGNGGVGYNGCVPATPPNIQSGGKGGNGGNGAGNSGIAGTGAVNGQAGTITVGPGGNGANGGDGMGPGEKGDKGTSTIGANGARTDIQDIFKDGAKGITCPGQYSKTAAVAQPAQGGDPQNHESVLAQVGSRPVAITVGANGAITVSGLFANSSIVLTGTISSTGAITMSGSGPINTNFGVRNVTVQFTGTISATGISGNAVVTPQGFGPATYPINIPL